MSCVELHIVGNGSPLFILICGRLNVINSSPSTASTWWKKLGVLPAAYDGKSDLIPPANYTERRWRKSFCDDYFSDILGASFLLAVLQYKF